MGESTQIGNGGPDLDAPTGVALTQPCLTLLAYVFGGGKRSLPY
jgi:hypothetical protein